MKRQLLVLTDYVIGGEWIALNRLTSAVERLFPGTKFYFLAFGMDIPYSDRSGRGGFLRGFVSDFRSGKKAIEKKTGDVGKFNYVLATNHVLLLASHFVRNLNGAKKIYYLHGLKSQSFSTSNLLDHKQYFYKIIEWLALMMNDIVITVFNYSWPFSLFKKVFVVPNSVPDDYFDKIGIKKNKYNILYSGRMSSGKGLLNLVKGFHEFSKDCRQASLIFCYPKSSVDKKLLKSLLKLVARLRLGGRVLFNGNVGSSDLKKIYHSSEVTILPSEAEMAPLSVIESLACGTPVIGTATGNMPEILKKIDSRLILRRNTSSEIASSLKWFFNLSDNQKARIKQRGYIASRFYGSENSANKFVRILESLR